jgi:hypothetical protein
MILRKQMEASTYELSDGTLLPTTDWKLVYELELPPPEGRLDPVISVAYLEPAPKGIPHMAGNPTERLREWITGGSYSQVHTKQNTS